MKRLELLDYGRFFAAIAVVAFHYTFNGIANGKISSITHISSIIDVTKYGYLGVEFFFMISGYVIFLSAKNRSASEFAVNRAVRLYPAYWFCILFTSFFAFFWGGDLMSVDLAQIIINFSMIQSLLGVAHVDGVYWTLVYEITFYFSVFLLLLFGLQRRLASIFIFWPIIFCIALIFELQSIPYLGGYYYYFSAGAIFAVLMSKFSFRGALSLLVVYVLCVYHSSGKVEFLTETRGVEYSPIIITMIITIFFILFACQNSKKGRSLSLPRSKTMGALTYPIYLIHAHFGYMIFNRFATDNNKIVIYMLTWVVVIFTAYFVNILVEERLKLFWVKFFGIVVGRPITYIQNNFRL